jgi:hypothetical protein
LVEASAAVELAVATAADPPAAAGSTDHAGPMNWPIIIAGGVVLLVLSKSKAAARPSPSVRSAPGLHLATPEAIPWNAPTGSTLSSLIQTPVASSNHVTTPVHVGTAAEQAFAKAEAARANVEAQYLAARPFREASAALGLTPRGDYANGVGFNSAGFMRLQNLLTT